jgi:hypothetical protein
MMMTWAIADERPRIISAHARGRRTAPARGRTALAARSRAAAPQEEV